MTVNTINRQLEAGSASSKAGRGRVYINCEGSHHVQRGIKKPSLCREFARSARRCKSWDEYRASVGRLIATAARTASKSEWRSKAWTMAGLAWAQAHPKPAAA